MEKKNRADFVSIVHRRERELGIAADLAIMKMVDTPITQDSAKTFALAFFKVQVQKSALAKKRAELLDSNDLSETMDRFHRMKQTYAFAQQGMYIPAKVFFEEEGARLQNVARVDLMYLGGQQANYQLKVSETFYSLAHTLPDFAV